MSETNANAPDERSASPVEPPRTLIGILSRIGPGIIITGSIVGSGELIVTTKLGAEVGFTLLWLIILSCVIKVFVQIELGRHVISSGNTTLAAFDLVPGPRLLANWIVWCWAVMALCTLLQLSGILTGVARSFVLAVEGPDLKVWGAGIVAVTALLLASGRYKHVERTTTFMVFVFTTVTLVAGAMLQGTEEYAVGAADVAHGLSFGLPAGESRAEALITAFGAFGITGVGASELIYYPYWCLEKGYASYVGPREDTPEWAARARGWIRVMKVDAWISMVIYTVGTVAFYFLGAAVLNRQGVVPEDNRMLATLSNMYTATFGEQSGKWIFLIGAFSVLFSTFFVATASNTRVFADALPVFRLRTYRDDGDRRFVVRILCLALPAFCFVMFLLFPESPVSLVMIGAVAQATMLPMIAFATVYLRYYRTDARIAPRVPLTELGLWAAVLTMFGVGVFQLWEQVRKLFQ